MPRFWIMIHHPDDYNPAASEDEAMTRDIDLLNDEMVAAGVRAFVGGLQPAHRARSLQMTADGRVITTDGPFLRTMQHVGGFWVLEVADLQAALVWGRKAAIACRTPVEVRQFNE